MPEPNQEAASLDTIFDLLSNPRRRFVLHYLQREEEPVSLSELAAQVAAKENDAPVEDLTSQQRKRAYVSLYQTHIPKLDEAGVIDYDADSGMVTLTDRADEIEDHLGGSNESLGWQRIYLAVAATGLAAYLLTLLTEAGETIRMGIGFLVLGVITALAVANYVYAHRADERTLDLVEEE